MCMLALRHCQSSLMIAVADMQQFNNYGNKKKKNRSPKNQPSNGQNSYKPKMDQSREWSVSVKLPKGVTRTKSNIPKPASIKTNLKAAPTRLFPQAGTKIKCNKNNYMASICWVEVYLAMLQTGSRYFFASSHSPHWYVHGGINNGNLYVYTTEGLFRNYFVFCLFLTVYQTWKMLL